MMVTQHYPDQEDCANFAVCGFTEEDCTVLRRGLAKFGINAALPCDDGGK
jgi:hypothetical protein